jgi:hypothetical protein
MRLFHKKYIQIFVFFTVISLTFGGGAIIVNDWQVGHRSHSIQLPPINWIGYKIEIFLAETKRKFIPDYKIGLPQVRLFISEQAQQALLSDIPTSTKKWKKGYKLNKDGKLKEVKVRHRGDNPANWMYGRKSWRVKSQKKDVTNRIRTFDYISPQGLPWEEYMALLLAKEVGLLTPKFRLVELFINSESSGIVLEKERLDESFLRNAGLMPVNLYKGEQFNTDAKIRVDDSLFNNPGLWSKQATFNHRAEENFSDMGRLINSIRRAETSVDDQRLLSETLPHEIWAKYGAYGIIGNTAHSDFIHNQRIVIDPWTGFAHPVVHDLAGVGTSMAPWDFSASDLTRILNMQPSYLLEKYRELYRLTAQKKVLSAVVTSMQELLEPLKRSIARDFHILQDVYEYDLDRRLLSPEFSINKVLNSLSAMQDLEKKMVQKLSKTPDAQWRSDGHVLFLSVDNELPVGKLFIDIPIGHSAPSEVTLDIDGDGTPTTLDMTLPVKLMNGKLVIDAIWFAERLHASVIKNEHGPFKGNLIIRKTQFRLIFPEKIDVQTVWVENPFSKQKTKLPEGKAEGFLPGPYYRPLVPAPEVKPIEWSGTVKIEEDRVIRHPVVIAPGTEILMSPGVSLVFRDKLRVRGTKNLSVSIRPSLLDQPWGTLALVGPNTEGSAIKHLKAHGGSGDDIDGMRFVGMLSIHNTSDISIDNVHLKNNHVHDDMMHIVYVSNLKMINSSLSDAKSDGLDIDLSNAVILEGVRIVNSGNDAIDLMGSEVIISQSTFTNSGDKGISVGEGSRAVVVNTHLERNVVGIEAKDGSRVQLLHSNLTDNVTQVSAYKKNWRYGEGGHVDIRKSILKGRGGLLAIKKGSTLYVRDSILIPPLPNKKRITIGQNIRNSLENTKVQADYGDGIMYNLGVLSHRPDAHTIGLSE